MRLYRFSQYTVRFVMKQCKEIRFCSEWRCWCALLHRCGVCGRHSSSSSDSGCFIHELGEECAVWETSGHESEGSSGADRHSEAEQRLPHGGEQMLDRNHIDCVQTSLPQHWDDVRCLILLSRWGTFTLLDSLHHRYYLFLCRPFGLDSFRRHWRSVGCCLRARSGRWRWCGRTSAFLFCRRLAPWRKSWAEVLYLTSASTAFSLCWWFTTEKNPSVSKRLECVWNQVLNASQPKQHHEANTHESFKDFCVCYCDLFQV